MAQEGPGGVRAMQGASGFDSCTMGSRHRWGSSRDLTSFVPLTDPGRRGHLSTSTPSSGQRGTQMAVVYSGTWSFL